MRRGFPESLREFEIRRLDDPRGVAEEIRPLFEELPREDLAAAAGIYGSCLRQLGKLDDALAAIDEGLIAARRLDQVWDEANLLQRQAVVIAAQGHFRNALGISRESLYLYLLADDSDRVGTVLVDQAMFEFHLQEFKACCQAHLAALRWLKEASYLNRYTAHLGLALSYRELRESELSLKHLNEAKGILPYLGESMASKFLWFEGRIACEVGRPDLAERLFRQVLPSFLASGQGLEAALATIELARALVAQGRVAEASRVAFESRKCLVHLPESSPAANIVQALWQQAQKHEVTEKLLEAAAWKLQREPETPAPPNS